MAFSNPFYRERKKSEEPCITSNVGKVNQSLEQDYVVQAHTVMRFTHESATARLQDDPIPLNRCSFMGR
ncbi:hypothetical protein PSCICO_41280 [Pseudomonas cichorii]|nr:hypothetical protein PSCICO_41280 [Pseudomonas cichorii]